jgi:hypothetical protein
MIAAIFCGGSNFNREFRFKVRSSMINTFYFTNKGTPIEEFK